MRSIVRLALLVSHIFFAIAIASKVAFFVHLRTKRRRSLHCRPSSSSTESPQENLQITSRRQQGSEDYAEQDEEEAGQGVVG
jgi:Flp pilus assembly protein TadB